MSTMAASRRSSMSCLPSQAVPFVHSLMDPVLIMLPDGGVRLYHEDCLQSADVTKDYPGHSLSNRAGGSRRPVLKPSFPLRQGGTYFLLPTPQPSATASRRLSLDAPRDGDGMDGVDVEDFRQRLWGSPGGGATLTAQGADRGGGTRTLRATLRSESHHSEDSISLYGAGQARKSLCPYCIPQGTLALSATWQLCPAHSGGRRVIRSSSQTASGCASKTPRGAQQVSSPEQPDRLDESCCITVTAPLSQGVPTPVLSLAVSRGQEQKLNSVMQELHEFKKEQRRKAQANKQLEKEQEKVAPVQEKQSWNPILDDLWEIERSATTGRTEQVNGFNPISEELWDEEERADTQNYAKDTEVVTGSRNVKGRKTKAIGKFFSGVRRVATWKPRSVSNSSKEELRSAVPGRRREQDSWNALPTSFTSAV